MAMCNCNVRNATVPVVVSVRVMGEFRDEERTVKFCQPCAEATVANGLGRAA